jgi:putative SOS response-associated peptidase YedK
MPVILTRKEGVETWLEASWPEAVMLQRPLPDGSLRIVARGEKKDEAPTTEEAIPRGSRSA